MYKFYLDKRILDSLTWEETELFLLGTRLKSASFARIAIKLRSTEVSITGVRIFIPNIKFGVSKNNSIFSYKLKEIR